MNSRHPIRLCVAALLLGAPVCSAQDAEPTAAPWAPHSPGAAPTLDRAARENAVKAEAVEKVRDERIKRVTRSVCAGCSGGAGWPPRRLAPGAEDEPRPRDPAQAPED